MFKGFIDGLKKSFSGKDYTRKLNKCEKCGKPAFFSTCLKCEVDEAFRGFNDV
jgi:hypothetical protein